MCWKNDDGATEYALPGVCCEPVIIGSDDLRGSKRHMTDPLCGAYWGGHENKARDRLWCPMALWLYIAIFFFAVGATVWVFGVAPCAGDGDRGVTFADAWYYQFGGHMPHTITTADRCFAESVGPRVAYSQIAIEECTCFSNTPTDTPWCEDRQARNTTGLCQKRSRCCLGDNDFGEDCDHWVQWTCTATRVWGVAAEGLVLVPDNGDPTIVSSGLVRSTFLFSTPEEALAWGRANTTVSCCQRTSGEILWGSQCQYLVDDDCARSFLAAFLLTFVGGIFLVACIAQLIAFCVACMRMRRHFSPMAAKVVEYNRRNGGL